MRQKSEYKINEAIAEFLDKYRLIDGYSRVQIAAIWKEIVGKLIARHTKRIELKESKLIMEINSPTVKNELLMLRSEIIARLNEKIGKELVKEIEIR